VFAIEARDAGYDARDSKVLAALVRDASAELDRDSDGRYIVEWDNATTGAIGRGFMNELERRGFHVGAPERYRVEVRPHRVMEPGDADGVLTVVGGLAVEMWRADPGAREIAYIERTSAQQAELPAGSGTAVFLTAPSTADE
jgi:hypothetical protein